MQGSYQMKSFNGDEFEVIIPAFSLDIPDQKRNPN